MSDFEETGQRTDTAQEGPNPVARLMRLFEGFDSAYGTHGATQRRAGAVKQEIKKSAQTLRGDVTLELWQGHVSGKKPIGIIPIRADSKCKWGCIDVDKYDNLNHAEIVKTLSDRKIPMAVLKSKSGGAHLVLFMADAQDAIEVRSVLGAIAASLGYGQSEIFPKQTQLLIESGDLGNWLNMPYLGGDETDRYAVKPNGMAMSLSEFLEFAEGLRLSEQQFAALASIPPADRANPGRAARSPRRKSSSGKHEGDPDPDAPPLSDGPPCLEHLASAGFGEGMRNNGLFALGLYCQKRYGDDWAVKLEEYNQQFMTPPLSAEEVSGIKRSLEKSDYQYSCKQQPLCNHCNQSLCRTRRHGISSNGDYPVISSLSVLDTDPPLWFLDVEDERIEVSTDELMTYRAFQKLIMERLHKCYRPMKQETWMNMVSTAMAAVTVIEAPQEVSLIGQFRELLTDFLTNRQKGTRIDDIHSGRPWEDEKERRHYFRLRDLQSYLEREGMRSLSRGQITTRIRDLGGNSSFKNIKSRGVNLFFVPSEAVEGPVSIGAPEIEKDPM